MWGNYLLHLFLAANGAQSVIANIFRIGPVIFYFAAATVAVHGLMIFGAGRLLRHPGLVGPDHSFLVAASTNATGRSWRRCATR